MTLIEAYQTGKPIREKGTDEYHVAIEDVIGCFMHLRFKPSFLSDANKQLMEFLYGDNFEVEIN